jgi:uncharacterized repeat protein (TIGR02543 family)
MLEPSLAFFSVVARRFTCLTLLIATTAVSSATTTVVPPSSADQIVGLRESSGPALGYNVDTTDERVGVSGSSGFRDVTNVVLGFALPTLPEGDSVRSAEFQFEITGARDQSDSNPSVQVHLLDVIDPSTSGVTYFFNGASDPSGDTVFVGSSYIAVGTSQVDFSDDQHDQIYTLPGDALARLNSYYGGDHIPDRTEVFFRFSLDIPRDTSELDRYLIDLAANESSLTITSGPPDTTPPTLTGADFANDAGPGDFVSGNVINYTISFDEDIDASTVEASDFGNAGSVAISIGAITETSPGILTVEVTPTGDGSLQLQINAAAVITDLSGNALDTSSPIVDDTSLTVSTANIPPQWSSSELIGGSATVDETYSDSLAAFASDLNNDALTFSKVDGADWLEVAGNGDVSGTPGASDVGLNIITVDVSDGTAPAVEVTLSVEVLPAGAWRSTLYQAGWTPPDESASFYNDKIIQDFSYAGYQRGEVPIPNITGPIFDVTDPTYGADPTGATDSTDAIQSAIDAAEAAGGGVVFMPAGSYTLSRRGDVCLLIDEPYVVLRGAGADSTFLTNTSTDMRGRDIIRVRAASATEGSAVSITSGLDGPTHRIPVASPGTFSIGDIVRIRWDFTEEWVQEHGQSSFWNTSNGFPDDARYFREVTNVNVSGGWIEVDIPTRYTIKVRDNGRVAKVNGLLHNVGLESFAIGNVQKSGSGFGENDYNNPSRAAYDVHSCYAIELNDVRDSWITGVESFQPAGNTTTAHLLSGGIALTNVFRTTVANCAMRRTQYGGGGGNGYMFRLQYSNENLIKDSIAEFNRHGFVVSHAGTSGNVFLRCEDRETQRATGSSGSYTTGGSGSDHHMHFSHSNLFDGCHAHNSFYTAHHRSTSGTVPHGLTSAHGTYWNTSGSGTRFSDVVRTIQARYGYVIGTSGNHSDVQSNNTGNTAPSDVVEGVGIGDSLYPQSLYLDQFSKRVGQTVTYFADGADSGSPPVDANSPHSSGDTVTVQGPGDLVRSGFSFAGWNTAPDGSGTAYAANDTFVINSPVALYAQWAGDSFTLSFDANGGNTPSPSSQLATNGETYGILATASRAGFNFAGWFTAPTGGEEVTAATVVDLSANITLYAQWSEPPTVDAGPDQNVSLAGAAPWTPAELTTEIWLDAADLGTITHDNGAVSQWDDKSGNDIHLTQVNSANQPTTGTTTVNGENALEFSNDYLFNAGGTNADIKSAFIVSVNNNEITSSSSDAGMMSIYGTDISSGDGLGTATGAFNDEVLTLFDEDSPNVFVDRQAVSSSTLPSIPVGTHLYSYVLNSDWFIGLDGSDDLRDLSSGTRHDLLYSNGLAIGGMLRDSNNPENFFDGAVGEVIMLSTSLNETERQRLEGYLAHKWGIVGSLPAQHPFKTAAPTTAGATVILSGGASDPESDPLEVSWSLVSGPAAVVFSDTSAVDPTVSFFTEGTYVLRLTADDGVGTVSDEVTIQVGDASDPFTEWSDSEGGAVTFNGDANGDGMDDGLAWLLGADSPSTNAKGLISAPQVTNGDLSVSFNMLTSAARGSAVLRVQYSTDLGVNDPWTDHTITVPEVTSTVDGIDFVITPVSGENVVQVEATVSADATEGTGRLFMRLVGEP